MTTLVFSSLTTEYVYVPVTADVSLNAQPVEIAIIPVTQEEPAEEDWYTAAWAGAAGLTRSAKLLVGPDETVTLVDGKYTIWARVTDTPKVPVLKSGLLIVT